MTQLPHNLGLFQVSSNNRKESKVSCYSGLIIDGKEHRQHLRPIPQGSRAMIFLPV